MPKADTRHRCTAEDPWSEEKGRRAYHPDAKIVDCGSDYDEAYECPHCGLYFTVELPQ